MAEPGDRLLAALPAVYRAADVTGDLARLLAAFEALLFDGEPAPDRSDAAAGAGGALPGLERLLPALPALFAPQGGLWHQGVEWRTPDRFLPWLVAWLGFTPHALFAPEALRRIAAGIVPLHGLRGTREHLERLLALCFEGELTAVEVDDRPSAGLAVGAARIGHDSRLASSRPFWFRVVVETDDASHPNGGGADAEVAAADIERRVRAVIDFARPACTAYELHLRRRPRMLPTPDGGDAPAARESS